MTADLNGDDNGINDSFSFVVIGHIRGKQDGMLHQHLDLLLSEVTKLTPDLVFLTGDMIWGSVAKERASHNVISNDWDILDSALEAINAPIYRVPGNHDIHDPVTRDIYFTRYGRPPLAVTFRDCLFILLNSSFIPEGDEPAPLHTIRSYTRGKQLDSSQISFVKRELGDDKQYHHVFLFMHHLLWWEDDAHWWSDVHSILVNQGVRAVFGGDWGPMKFSHLQRDDIDYIQTSIDDEVSLQMLRALEGSRILDQQFDNFLHVTINGPHVDIEVKTFGEFASQRYTPARWRNIHWFVPPKEPLLTRAWAIIGTPRRLIVLVVLMGACFLTGVWSMKIWPHRATK
jgi:hypothetical protein